VEIRIDGASYAAEYGLPRPDATSLFDQPAYANAGYFIKLKADQFTIGPHAAFFRVSRTIATVTEISYDNSLQEHWIFSHDLDGCASAECSL
jgi:hypothetical protein